MPTAENGETLSEEVRRAMVLAFVGLQDGGAPVAKSRANIAKRCGVTEQQVKMIEREGIDSDWPPL